MKLKNIIIGISCILAIEACNDEMNYNEFVSYSKKDIFSSFDRTRSFVTDIYGHMQYDFGNYYSGAMFASACDEAQYAWSYSDIHDFNNGAWSAANPKAAIWSIYYEGIRAVNFYLDASVGQTFEDFKHNRDYYEQMERFERYQYEVRFLRAFFYFELVRQYGDIPFSTTVMTESEANTLSRTSASEVIDFIVGECDAIAEELPVTYSDLSYTETGRVVRGAVLALKARTLLYKASPLFNTSGNSEYWREAAIANKAVIDFCAANNISLGNYSALWGTENYNNPEMLFVRRIGDLNWLEAYNFPIGVEGGRSGNCPTQTLVDAYEMQSTGKRWNEAGSGYDQENPYNNRDPRLSMTIAINNEKGWPTYNSTPLQTYEGGSNGSPTPGATPTGYYLKKYLDASVDLRPDYTNSKRHSYIIFRLGEFYLNYAEAVFYYLKGADAKDATFTLSAREAVSIVRNRADVKMPAFPEGLSNSEFEEKYRNERMVELAFEGHRFYDVRRWKKGELLRSVTLMNIKKTGEDTYSYTRVQSDRFWNDRMYFFPVPAVEQRKNPALTQNPGW